MGPTDGLALICKQNEVRSWAQGHGSRWGRGKVSHAR